MNDGSLKTLFHPIEAGLIEGPGEGAKVLFLNAVPFGRLPEGFPPSISLQQGFRPVFRQLAESRHNVVPVAEGEGYDVILVLAGRHRGQNELWVAEALQRARPGGMIVIAGGKTEGGASLRKRMAGLLPIDDYTSTNHGVVFWLTRPEDVTQAVATLEADNPPTAIAGGFMTLPGVFSQDHVDEGSRLLVQNLPENLKGQAADFGAGWGYLSVKLAERSPEIRAIDLFEANHTACRAAEENVAHLATGVACRVLWHDLLAEPVERRYDVIVMNPPFHQGRAAEPSIGEGMIRAASRGLKPGGKLFLVANRQLPYEPVLAGNFARSGELLRDTRFKLLWAVR